MTEASRVSVRIDAGPDRPDVVWLDNGDVRLGLVPDLGGRLLSAAVQGHETLWRNDDLLDERLHPRGHRPAPVSGELADWVNYGGDKTWPAPQGWDGPGQWAGPPDPVLDSGPYAYRVTEKADAVSVAMTSADDQRTGLRLSRTFTVCAGTPGWELDIAAINTSDRPVEWALWNVVQRAAGTREDGGVFVGIEPGSDPGAVPVVIGTGVPQFEQVGDDRVRVPHQEVVGKVGFRSANGWIAHSASGTTTAISFDVEDATYPDGGCRVEVWLEHPLAEPLGHLGGLRPTASIVEVEVLGPLRVLAPDASMRLRMRCVATPSGSGDVLGVDQAGRARELHALTMRRR
jgi:hypothetical protein